MQGGAVCVCKRHGEGEGGRGGVVLSASFSVCNAALPSPAIMTANKAWECIWVSRMRNMP